MTTTAIPLPTPAPSRRSAFDWVFAALVLAGTAYAFWRYNGSMDGYEKAVLLGSAPSLIALGWFWAPLRTLSLVVGAASLLAIGLYSGHRDAFGADLAVAEQLFTPFFTTKAEGMGLGLSLCRTVVEQHGGALVHEAAQPRGTTFRFTLPVA